jgi:hypothetical protein
MVEVIIVFVSRVTQEIKIPDAKPRTNHGWRNEKHCITEGLGEAMI